MKNRPVLPCLLALIFTFSPFASARRAEDAPRLDDPLPHSSFRPLTAERDHAAEPEKNEKKTAPPASTSEQIAAALNREAILAEIRRVQTDARPALYSQIEANVQTTTHALAEVRRAGRELRGEARAEFAAAYDRVRVSEESLRQSVRAAREAAADAEASAHAQLAAAYTAYADAVCAAELAARRPDAVAQSANP